MSVVLEARLAGSCFSCNFGIRPGQMIQLNEDAEHGGRWEHVTCPAGPAVCGECFTEVTPSGACMCGAF